MEAEKNLAVQSQQSDLSQNSSQSQDIQTFQSGRLRVFMESLKQELGDSPELLRQALAYLRDEKDVRGFDARKGWIHSAAHTADLLAALAEHPFFSKQDQSAVLDAITQRLATAGEVFTYGEQDRLANVVSRIVTRDDAAFDAFRKWLAEMDAADQSVWKDSPPKLAPLIRFENDSYLLRALIAQLLQRPSSPGSLEAQKAVLQSLKRR